MAQSRLFKSYLPDQKTDRAVGIKLPLNKDTYERIRTGVYIEPIVKNKGIFTQSYSTEEQAISNMINLLLTRPGERPMQPKFGSPIPDYQFEPNSPGNQHALQNGVEETIKLWLPYIDLISVTVQYGTSVKFPHHNDEHTAAISISFRITKAGANRTITIYTDGISFPTYDII